MEDLKRFMPNNYKTIYQGAVAEIVEKKSRFIATVSQAESEEEALSFIETIKKKNWNATHNCSSFVVGERGEIVRQSDDGEPSGTAGKPMLDVLCGAGLTNTVVVVTRHFGGTLLGTGGLVRAYSKAVQAGLEASTIIEKIWGTKLSIETDYNGIGKIQYFLGEKQIPIMNSIYEENVKIEILLPQIEVPTIKPEIIEITNGKAKIKEVEELYFAVFNNKILVGAELKWSPSSI